MATLFDLTRDSDTTVIALSLAHTLDLDAIDDLSSQLFPLITEAPGQRWILEMSAVEYLGSAALGFLVNIRQRIQSTGGRMMLCGLSDPLAQLFRDTALERLFPVARTRADAVRLLK